LPYPGGISRRATLRGLRIFRCQGEQWGLTNGGSYLNHERRRERRPRDRPRRARTRRRRDLRQRLPDEDGGRRRAPSESGRQHARGRRNGRQLYGDVQPLP